MDLAEALSDDLLDARVVEVALPGWFPADELVDGVSNDMVPRVRGIVDGEHISELARLELADLIVGFGVAMQCRFWNEAAVAPAGTGIGIF